MPILKRVFPFLGWFEKYDLATLRADFISGLTVALVLVPQSMAYAQLAGLPAYYGLYAAFLPPMVASLFGSSAQLATGPVAIVSLMTSATLAPLATAGSQSFIAYALLLALMVGSFQFLLGILRLGLIVNFLSHPVVNGFTNAAALIIATSQLSKIFGIYVDNAPHHYETVYRVIAAAFEFTHWPTLGMAVLSFATMVILRRVNRRIPNVLVAVVITTALSWAIGFDKNETVPLANIESARVAKTVESFQAAMASKEQLESFRTTSKRDWEKLKASDAGLCLRCHEGFEIDWWFARRPGDAEDQRVPPERLVMLHEGSGLIDQQIAGLKNQISGYRTELRFLPFVRAEVPGDGVRFYVRGEVPSGVKAEEGTWRLKVGEKPLATDALQFQGGGAVVATIPEGLPAIRVPAIDWTIAPQLFAAAVIISVLGFMEAISIAKAMAARTRQKLDPNQELIGQGLANIIGCLGQSYAVSGSFSRSAVNLQAGARTGLSNVFSSAVVMAVLLFLSRWLYHLPQAVLASVIMMAVVGLLNVSGFLHAWRTNRLDGFVALITFFGTLVFAPHLEWGIFMGVGLSIGAYLYRTMRPRVVELAPHQDGSLRDARVHGLRKCEHIAIVSFEGPLNFASASYLETEILDRIAELPGLRHLLVVGNGISEIDASGEEMLRHLVDNVRSVGYEVSFASMTDNVLSTLKRSHLHSRIGETHFFPSRAAAIAGIYASAHVSSDEADCPYRKAMPPLIELSLHPDGSLRDAERHGLRLCRHIAALRFDAPLVYANTAFMEQEILRKLSDRPALRHVVLVAHGISDIDATGAEKLGDLVERLRSDGFAVSFSGLKEDVVDLLERTDTARILGKETMYPTQLTAIAGIYARTHAGSSEVDCPLRSLAPHLTELSLYTDGRLRNAAQYGLPLCETIGVLRFDGPLVFSTRKAIQSEFIRWAMARPTVRYLVFLAHTLPKLSPREADNLLAFVDAVREADYRVAFAGFADQTFEGLARSGVADSIGLDDIFASDMLALGAKFAEAHAAGAEQDCPLRPILPRMVELSLHEDGSLRDARRRGLTLCQRMVVVRFEGPLNFATFGFFEQELRAILERRPEARHILISGHTLSEIDPIAAEELEALIERSREAGYSVAISGLKDDIVEMLRQSGRLEAIGADRFFPTQALAISANFTAAHAGRAEHDCPLRPILPRMVELSLHEDGSLRDARRHGLALCERVIVVRFDGPLNYATFGFFEQELRAMEERRPEARHILLAGHTLSEIDSSAAEELHALIERSRGAGYSVVISGLKDDIVEALRRSGRLQAIGADRFFPTQAQAIASIHGKAHEGSGEQVCPLLHVVRARG